MASAIAASDNVVLAARAFAVPGFAVAGAIAAVAGEAVGAA